MSSVARFDTWQAADGTNVARFVAGELQVWNGSAFVALDTGPKKFEYVVVAGGGGGGYASGAGGGAGGYRSAVSGEASGGGFAAGENPVFLSTGASFTVTIGAGGSGRTSSNPGVSGVNTVFGSITATGGGGGGGGGSGGLAGGSGGGGSPVGVSTKAPAQGFNGGAVGGGGAAEVGGTDGANAGGDGVASSITGSSVFRAGGGGDPAGDGGGGGPEADGAANTGGGGGYFAGIARSGNGGSGVVIVKYPDTITLTIGVGLTSSTTTSGGFKITSFTAGTDTVSF